MLTLGFGLASLLKRPQWASQHVGNYQRNNPIMPAENMDDRYANNKSYTINPGSIAQKSGSIFDEKNKADITSGLHGAQSIDKNTSIFDKLNNIDKGLGSAGGIQTKGSDKSNNIFAMMNQFDSKHSMNANSIGKLDGMNGGQGLNGLEDQLMHRKKLNLFA